MKDIQIKKIVNVKVLTILILILSLILYSCNESDGIPEDTTPYETLFEEVGGNSLQVFAGGKGGSTIVFECGLGDDGPIWFANNLFQEMLTNNQVIAYNRAGHCPSTFTEGEIRGLESMTNDLATLISVNSLNEKVILVGHSLGGAIIRNYAIHHPGKVKALLFIDPTHEDYNDYDSLSQTIEDEMVQHYHDLDIPGGALEAAQLIENRSILQNLPSLPNIPVVVITSMKLSEGTGEPDRQDWFNAHQTLGEGISNFRHISTTNSGHYIFLEEPQLIIGQINELSK